jgi:hypothetical protein
MVIFVEDAVDLVSSVLLLLGRGGKLASTMEYSMLIGGLFQAGRLGCWTGERACFGSCSVAVAESFGIRRHGRFLVEDLAVTSKAAGFPEVGEETRSRDFAEEAGHFGVDPFDEVLVVDFVGGYVPLADVVGATGAVDTVDSRLLQENVLERFVLLDILNQVLHEVPAKASY